jgi:hypothetical protein
MKTAIAIDSLLLKDESTFLVELVLNLFPNSEIYSIVHQRGSILGMIENRPIVSSFLTHRVQDYLSLEKKFWIVPSAVKAIPIHKSIQKMIIITRGYIHGMRFPDHLDKYLYIFDWDFIDQPQLGWQKFFKPYVNNWREKSLINFSNIAVSSEILKQKLCLPNAEVIYPTFRTEDYTFVRDEDHNFIFTHHLIYSHGLTEDNLRSLIKVLTELGETIRVLGPDLHLEILKKEFPQVAFAGDHCDATNSLYSHQAKAVWDLSIKAFPAKAFGALANGRPVIVRDIGINQELLNKGTYFLMDFSRASILAIQQKVQDNYLSIDRKALRRLGLRWNERLFKSKMAKFLNKNNL